MDNHEITRLVVQAMRGDRQALNNLLPLIESEIRAGAVRLLERKDGSKQVWVTELVNGALLKFFLDDAGSGNATPPANKATFFRYFYTSMIRVLTEILRQQDSRRDSKTIPRILQEALARTSAIAVNVGGPWDRKAVVRAIDELVYADSTRSQLLRVGTEPSAVRKDLVWLLDRNRARFAERIAGDDPGAFRAALADLFASGLRSGKLVVYSRTVLASDLADEGDGSPPWEPASNGSAPTHPELELLKALEFLDDDCPAACPGKDTGADDQAPETKRFLSDPANVIFMLYFEHLSIKEVAGRLDLPENRVYKIKKHAEKKLQKILEAWPPAS